MLTTFDLDRVRLSRDEKRRQRFPPQRRHARATRDRDPDIRRRGESLLAPAITRRLIEESANAHLPPPRLQTPSHTSANENSTSSDCLHGASRTLRSLRSSTSVTPPSRATSHVSSPSSAFETASRPSSTATRPAASSDLAATGDLGPSDRNPRSLGTDRRAAQQADNDQWAAAKRCACRPAPSDKRSA